VTALEIEGMGDQNEEDGGPDPEDNDAEILIALRQVGQIADHSRTRREWIIKGWPEPPSRPRRTYKRRTPATSNAPGRSGPGRMNIWMKINQMKPRETKSQEEKVWLRL
jgi:hypothetical protein